MKPYILNRNRVIEFEENTIYILYIHFLKSNIITTLTTMDGQVITWCSSGKLGFVGFKKNSVEALYEIILYYNTLSNLNTSKGIICRISGFGEGFSLFLSELDTIKFPLIRIENISRYSFNGCRSQKAKKI